MKFTVGKKEHMTELFDESGIAYPVTVISAEPVTVTQIKTPDKDGYAAVQLGVGKAKEKNLNKAERGKGLFARLIEFRTPDSSVNIGGELQGSEVFAEGDTVTVSSVSKGKGFQGVVKRHRFSGGPRTHGQKHSEREPGSIGAGGVQRVLKGTRMAGRMGGERVTVKNLTIVKIDPENNLLFIKGAVPGRRGTLVEIRG